MIGIGKPNRSASRANQAVLRDGGPELRVGQHAGEVVEADEGRGRDEVRLLHAHHERPQDREPGEQPEHDEQRQQEQDARQAVPARGGSGGGAAADGAFGRRG